MKQPRVTDFDPNAKVPKLSSPMDHLPTIERPKKPEPARDITRQLKQARDGTQSDELKQSSFFRPAQDSATRIQPKPAPSPTTPHSLDLLEIAHNDISVRLSDQELETIEDLKTDLRNKYRINVPKNDIIRSALHYIVDDYRKSWSSSIMLSRLKRKHK